MIGVKLMQNLDLIRIDRQIEDLQRMKAAYQGIQQAPINNIINTQQVKPLFEARFTTESPSNVYVNNKTAFINLTDGLLTIKEPDSSMVSYEIVLPKDEKDIKIEQLENKLKEMEMRLNGYTEPNKSIICEQKPNANGDGDAPKSKSKGDFFKSSK